MVRIPVAKRVKPDASACSAARVGEDDLDPVPDRDSTSTSAHGEWFPAGHVWRSRCWPRAFSFRTRIGPAVQGGSRSNSTILKIRHRRTTRDLGQRHGGTRSRALPALDTIDPGSSRPMLRNALVTARVVRAGAELVRQLVRTGDDPCWPRPVASTASKPSAAMPPGRCSSYRGRPDLADPAFRDRLLAQPRRCRGDRPAGQQTRDSATTRVTPTRTPGRSARSSRST